MRGYGAYLLLVLVVVLGGTFTWMTLHPDAPVLERAETWPVVGPAVELFRSKYLSPETAAPDGASGEGEDETVLDPDPRLEGVPPVPPDELPPRGVVPFVWVSEGDALREEPSPAADVLFRYAKPERLSILEQRGDWYRVTSSRTIRVVGEPAPVGWVHLPDYDEVSDPPFGSETKPLLPLESTPPDADLLAEARGLLEGERVLTIGPYTVYTDGGDAALFRWLDRVVGSLDAVYAERYGVRPRGTPREVVVLYRTEAQYRALQQQHGRIAGISAGGHAFRGLAATWIEERPRETLAGVVVHELVHLLNRRAIGPSLPPWLDEGLASDLAASRITESGELRVDEIGGAREEIGGGRVLMDGGRSAVYRLRAAFAGPDPPELERLLRASWDEFVLPDDRDLHYAHAGLWVRFLLDGKGERKSAFLDFLGDVARGEKADGGVFLSALSESLDESVNDFEKWVYAKTPRDPVVQ